MNFNRSLMLRSPLEFPVCRSLQSDYGKQRNAGGKAAARELKDKK
jgi:hypothetical protein